METQRLILRQWQDADLPVFASLNADPEVMEFYPSPLSRKESDALAQKIIAKIEQNGWGFWALEHRADQSFMGFVGLNEPTYALPVSPCIEIGWRLARRYWSQGFATEAAQSSLAFAFEQLDLDEVYAFASVVNERSQAVMRRLNMVDTHKNFEHPLLAESEYLKEHVLYKIERKRWLELRAK